MATSLFCPSTYGAHTVRSDEAPQNRAQSVYCGKLGVAQFQPRAKRRSYHLHQFVTEAVSLLCFFFDLLRNSVVRRLA